MEKTKFRKLGDDIEALAPMCNFGTPRVICTNKEEFIRARYEWLNRQFSELININGESYEA